MEQEQFADLALKSVLDRPGNRAVAKPLPGMGRAKIIGVLILGIMDQHVGAVDEADDVRIKTVGTFDIGGVDNPSFWWLTRYMATPSNGCRLCRIKSTVVLPVMPTLSFSGSSRVKKIDFCLDPFEGNRGIGRQEKGLNGLPEIDSFVLRAVNQDMTGRIKHRRKNGNPMMWSICRWERKIWIFFGVGSRSKRCCRYLPARMMPVPASRMIWASEASSSTEAELPPNLDILRSGTG